MSYLIFCKERSHDGIACWWRPDSKGYTTDVSVAGRYAEGEAMEIYRGSRGQDFPVPEEAIGISLHARLILDIGDNGNDAALREFERAALGKEAKP